MANKLKVGVLGATGMVGQRFVSLLADHPWFEVTAVAASPSSAGKIVRRRGRGPLDAADAGPRRGRASSPSATRPTSPRSPAQVDFVFCAVDMAKDETAKLEEDYARAETPLVSNNSAHRWTPDVPMMVPEINADHAAVIEAQRKRLGTKRGFIAVKPNCSIQSYVPAIHPLLGVRPHARSRCARTRRSPAPARRSRPGPR